MKFVDHIDHVTWVSYPETIADNVALFSRLFDVVFDAPSVRNDMGFTVYLCWEAGLEIVCPHAAPTDFNQTLHDHLARHGEGMMSIVFGVRDLEATRLRLEQGGFAPGPLWGNAPGSPWVNKVNIKEREAGIHMNTWMIFGEIDYAEGVVGIA